MLERLRTLERISDHTTFRTGVGRKNWLFWVYLIITIVLLTTYFCRDCRFNGVFSRNNLPKIKDGAHIKNLDDKNSKETHWISLFVDRNLAVYFDSFGIEYIPPEVLNKIRNKSIIHNIFRIQDNESIMRRFYCTAFIEYMLAGKTLLDYTNFFSPNDYKKNDKIIYRNFKDKI